MAGKRMLMPVLLGLFLLGAAPRRSVVASFCCPLQQTIRSRTTARRYSGATTEQGWIRNHGTATCCGGGSRAVSRLRLQQATAPEEGGRSGSDDAAPVGGPDLLLPFPPAADPMYACTGPVGVGDFVASRTGNPTREELADENLLKIVKVECTDLEVNTLVWKCLGYRFDAEACEWTPSEVFPNWKDRFPDPPDLIGMRRIYEKEVDQPSLRSNQALVRSVPVEHKQGLKRFLKPLGWTGYQYSELTPNKTRRAQCANWLFYYREALFGKSLEELQEAKRRKQQQEEQEAAERGDDIDQEWKPPVKEVF